ncbi:MAG: LLM class flavin-dependent oxidoreductase [Actinomycetota bacterium]
MKLAMMTEPQLGGTYDDLLFAARAVEDAGLAGFARSDHYYWSRQPGAEATEALTTLATLARDTSKVRLGVLVSPITFHHPAGLAKAAATIDQMSGGRLDFGLGTGWMEAEHNLFGMPFPSWNERFDRLEEALGYVRAAFSGETFQGRHYQLGVEAQPRPTGLRIVVGGSGPERTPGLAGRFADEYNQTSTPLDRLGGRIERMRQAAAEAGRDPMLVSCSVMGPLVVATTRARIGELMTEAAEFRRVSVAELEARWQRSGVPFGSPDQVAQVLAAYADVGIDRYYMQWFNLTDRRGIAELAALAGELGKISPTAVL